MAGAYGRGYQGDCNGGAAVKGLLTTEVSTQRGVLHSVFLANLDASVCYLQIFDVASHSSVTLGTTTPDQVIHVAASAERTLPLLDWGFNNGCVIAATTTATGNTSPSTGLSVNLTYS